MMKIYNHKKVLALMYTQTAQVSHDPQERAMSEKQIRDVAEMLLDCGCTVCGQLLSGFQMALMFIGKGDYPAASVSLSVTLEKIGLLNIPHELG